VRLIGADGSQLGIVTIDDALRRSSELGIDLLEVSPQADPPVCRIADFSKFRYEKEKRLKEAKKKQHLSQVKEVRMRPRIGVHDFEVKVKHIREFLERKDRVKLNVIFYGRENMHRDLGMSLMEKVKLALADVALIEEGVKRDGNRLSLMIAPKK
jgi:translation initiation factor IF-3